MSELKDKYIRFDWAIKRLLRQKANFGVLEGFLTVFLGESITIVEILESESNQTSADDKFNRVDIKARNSKGDIIIIEVQNTRELYYLERVLYGVAKAITEHINLGNSYEQVKKVYSISILYFDLGLGSDYLYHGQNQFVGVHTKDLLQIRSKERDAIVSRLPSEIFPAIDPETFFETETHYLLFGNPQPGLGPHHYVLAINKQSLEWEKIRVLFYPKFTPPHA